MKRRIGVHLFQIVGHEDDVDAAETQLSQTEEDVEDLPANYRVESIEYYRFLYDVVLTKW